MKKTIRDVFAIAAVGTVVSYALSAETTYFEFAALQLLAMLVVMKAIEK